MINFFEYFEKRNFDYKIPKNVKKKKKKPSNTNSYEVQFMDKI